MAEQKKQRRGRKLPYLLNSDPYKLELDFYERYNENFLFNKAVTLMYAIEQGEEFRESVQRNAEDWQGGS